MEQQKEASARLQKSWHVWVLSRKVDLIIIKGEDDAKKVATMVTPNIVANGRDEGIEAVALLSFTSRKKAIDTKAETRRAIVKKG